MQVLLPLLLSPATLHQLLCLHLPPACLSPRQLLPHHTQVSSAADSLLILTACLSSAISAPAHLSAWQKYEVKMLTVGDA